MSCYQDKYLGLFSSDLNSPDWVGQELLVNLDLLAGADSADLYFEGSPHTTDFSLDDVSLREFVPEDWREQADDRIDHLRQGSVSHTTFNCSLCTGRRR